MKKILLSASLLLVGIMTAFAQMPDASRWQTGQEITYNISWGNLNFKNDSFDYWILNYSSGIATTTGGLFEMYDSKDVELFQLVQLPAGVYKVECQGYYRHGASWSDDPNTFGTDEWQDNAMLQVQNGYYDIASNEFFANRTFKTPLMPRLFPAQTEQLYLMPEGEAVWDMSDGYYSRNGLSCWGPCSVPGSKVWFDAGLYAPYDDGEGTKYNTVTFYLTQDGWAKIGVVKQEPKSADGFCVTNFKLYYEGEVDPKAAELVALQAEVQEYYNQLLNYYNKYSESVLYVLIDDAICYFDDEYGIPDELEVDQCALAKEYLQELIAKIEAAEAAYVKLQKLLPTAKNLYNSTDYAGKVDYQAAIQAAENCFDPDYEMGEDEGFDSFQKAYDNLVAARLAYLLTQEKVNGAYNFSSAINFPFFCNNEYTPTWNEEEGCFKYIDEIENTWVAGYGEKSVKEVMSEHPDWIDICSDVTWTQKSDAIGEWIYNHNVYNGWMGSIDNVTMQHGYTAVSAWSGSPTGGYQEMRQTITGLPAGYYAMSALFINSGNEPSEYNQYVYINAGSEPNDETMEKAQFTHKGEHWWWGTDNVHLWRTDDWQQLRTNMIQVGEDGVVTIGSRSNGFYAVTGFQLYYYGETPDFAAIIQPKLDKVYENIDENLIWLGDIVRANEILASVDIEEITDVDAYLAALAVIAEANDYVTTASTVVKNWRGLENFQALMEKQEVGSPEETLVQTAWSETLEIGEGDNDTYELAIQNDMDYAAYVHYLDFRASMGDFINNEGVAAVVTTQNAYLAENFANAETLDRMEKELAALYNKALLANASANNPVDITALIINPKFDEGPNGWMGEPIVTGAAIDAEIGSAEKWNCNFDVYQTIYSLPAGLYKVECQAFYRDANNATDAYYNWLNGEYRYNQNALLYANNEETPIVSIASEKFTDRSMTAFRDQMWSDDDGEVYYHWVAMSEDSEDLPAELDWELLDVNPDGWYWDTIIDDFYYPFSLMGASRRLIKSPNAYHNEVVTRVEEGGSLQLGIKKDNQIYGDWVVFDNFRLLYLGNGEMPQVLLGDANCDGIVDIVDVTTLVDFILERQYPNNAQWNSSDVNRDGYIDVVDLTSIVQIILGTYDNASGAYGAKSRTVTSDALTVEDSSISLENSRDYVGFQMDVTVSDDAQFRGVQLSDRSEDHSVTYSRIAENTYRIVSYSVSGTPFSGNTGTLLNVKLSGGSVKSISNAVFSNGSRGFAIEGGDGTTNLDEIVNGESAAGEYYDLSGRRVTTVKKGGIYLKKGGKVLAQ